MSVTKDFEKREQHGIDTTPDFAVYLVSDITELLTHTRALEAILKERAGFYYKRDVTHQQDHPHCKCRPCTDARVAKLLEGVE